MFSTISILNLVKKNGFFKFNLFAFILTLIAISPSYYVLKTIGRSFIQSPFGYKLPFANFFTVAICCTFLLFKFLKRERVNLAITRFGVSYILLTVMFFLIHGIQWLVTGDFGNFENIYIHIWLILTVVAMNSAVKNLDDKENVFESVSLACFFITIPILLIYFFAPHMVYKSYSIFAQMPEGYVHQTEFISVIGLLASSRLPKFYKSPLFWLSFCVSVILTKANFSRGGIIAMYLVLICSIRPLNKFLLKFGVVALVFGSILGYLAESRNAIISKFVDKQMHKILTNDGKELTSKQHSAKLRIYTNVSIIKKLPFSPVIGLGTSNIPKYYDNVNKMNVISHSHFLVTLGAYGIIGLLILLSCHFIFIVPEFLSYGAILVAAYTFFQVPEFWLVPVYFLFAFEQKPVLSKSFSWLMFFKKPLVN